MKGKASHFEIHVSKPDETIPFYRELLSYFEWKVLGEWPGGLGIGDENGVSLWFMPTPDDHRRHDFDRDATGLSHLAIWVEDQAAVDTFVREYMEPHGIAPQFETPRARDDFGGKYYQVMFVDPEGLAVEVYTT